MSISEIKSELDRMTASQRAEIQGHMRILRWKETSNLADSLADAHRRIDAGSVVSEDVVETHLVRLRQSNELATQ